MSRRQGFTLAARASLPSSGAVSKEQEGGLSIALVLQVAGEAAWGFPGGCQSQEKRKKKNFCAIVFSACRYLSSSDELRAVH